MWKIKVIIQLILSHIPFGTKINHLLQIMIGSFKPDKLLFSFCYQAEQIRDFNLRHNLKGLNILEIGPGWLGIAWIIFYFKDVKKIISYDHNRHFNYKIANKMLNIIYNNKKKCALSLGITNKILSDKLNPLLNAQKNKKLINILNIDYHAPDNFLNNTLTNDSMDMTYSYGVLEHIPDSDLKKIIGEFYRLLKKNCYSYHNIGLHDHYHNSGLGNGINMLKYSDWCWNFFTGNKLAYHNRLRLPDYIDLFKMNNFKIDIIDIELTEININELKKIKVDKRFNGYSLNDLAASSLFIDLNK